MLRAAHRRGPSSVINGLRAAGGFSQSHYDVVVVSFSMLDPTAPHRKNDFHITTSLSHTFLLRTAHLRWEVAPWELVALITSH